MEPASSRQGQRRPIGEIQNKCANDRTWSSTPDLFNMGGGRRSWPSSIGGGDWWRTFGPGGVVGGWWHTFGPAGGGWVARFWAQGVISSTLSAGGGEELACTFEPGVCPAMRRKVKASKHQSHEASSSSNLLPDLP